MQNFVSIIVLTILFELSLANKVLQIKEEVEIGYFVDYLKLKGDQPLRIFNIRDRGVDCFMLEEATGKLLVKKRIDREDICPNKIDDKFSENRCEIIIKFAYGSVSTLEKVVIVVEDINDNPPSWNKPSITVRFTENEPVGSRLSLPEATDRDVGVNGQIIYQIDQKFRNYFRLFVDNGLYLENIQILDREKQQTYSLIITAIDNGNPSKSSELNVYVEIVDVNDNAPQFVNSLFRPDKLLPENTEPGTVILKLQANDADTGTNGEVNYKINPNAPSNAVKFFQVTTNGEIIVRQKLDYDSGPTRFEFKVIAFDKALPPYSKSSEATVEIDIQDINDEYPKITFYPLNPDLKTGFAQITENTDALTPIGQLSVTDIDFKGQDKVSCEMSSSKIDMNNNNSPILIMTGNEPQEFQIVSNRKFDFELEPVISAEIRCSDSAKHMAKLNLTILVVDVNDNPPEFLKSIFHLYIDENLSPGTLVEEKISLRDKDSGPNGQITLMVSQPEDSYFSVDQKAFTLRSKVKFDRETKSSYHLHLIATDNGSPRLSSTCRAIVHIRDINDNPVIIASSFYSFHVPENNKRQYHLGFVEANDSDNQTIFFNLDYKSKKTFSIENHSGKLSVQSSLDREKQDTHFLVVYASDGIHTATTTVTVFVDDLNDNPPVFVSPNFSNKLLTLDSNEAPGYHIKKINVTDLDCCNNNLIKYEIKKSNSKSALFNLDKDTGDLYLGASLRDLQESNAFLDLEACDQGKPPLCTVLTGVEIQWKAINVRQTDKGNTVTNNFKFENIFNENVLIIAISILLFFMIVILVGFFIIKRKTVMSLGRLHRTDGPGPTKTVAKNLIGYPENYGPPNYHCSTELDNLDKEIRLHNESSTTPIFHCSSLFVADSKEKSEKGPVFLEFTTDRSPTFDHSTNPNDFSQKYYSKYMVDRYLKISNTDSSTSFADSSNGGKIQNTRNQSSFV